LVSLLLFWGSILGPTFLLFHSHNKCRVSWRDLEVIQLWLRFLVLLSISSKASFYLYLSSGVPWRTVRSSLYAQWSSH
jgi:hypothetical protein